LWSGRSTFHDQMHACSAGNIEVGTSAIVHQECRVLSLWLQALLSAALPTPAVLAGSDQEAWVWPAVLARSDREARVLATQRSAALHEAAEGCPRLCCCLVYSLWRVQNEVSKLMCAWASPTRRLLKQASAVEQDVTVENLDSSPRSSHSLLVRPFWHKPVLEIVSHRAALCGPVPYTQQIIHALARAVAKPAWAAELWCTYPPPPAVTSSCYTDTRLTYFGHALLLHRHKNDFIRSCSAAKQTQERHHSVMLCCHTDSRTTSFGHALLQQKSRIATFSWQKLVGRQRGGAVV
jgi:hypothetical protein